MKQKDIYDEIAEAVGIKIRVAPKDHSEMEFMASALSIV